MTPPTRSAARPSGYLLTIQNGELDSTQFERLAAEGANGAAIALLR
jgi:hypothetical protein